MTETRTYYDILGVQPDADAAAITSAYRRLALRYHPDRDPSPYAYQRILIINAVYHTLKHPGRRAMYDAKLDVARSSEPVAISVEQPAMTLARRVASEPPRATGAPAANPKSDPGVIDFGRYAGQSLAQIARKDPEYLEWLSRSSAGRHLRHAIEEVLRPRSVSRSPSGAR